MTQPRVRLFSLRNQADFIRVLRKTAQRDSALCQTGSGFPVAYLLCPCRKFSHTKAHPVHVGLARTAFVVVKAKWRRLIGVHVVVYSAN